MRALFGCIAAIICLAYTTHADARRWLRAESPSFIVYSDAGESALRRQIGNLETYDSVLRTQTGAPAERSPARLEVFLLSSSSSLRIVKPSEITMRISGFYEARPEITAAFAYMEDSWDGAAQHTLFHEYAHHFMMQYFPTAYPIWYGEGVAEYFATTSIRGDRVDVGNADPSIAAGLTFGAWMPLSRLLTERTAHLNNTDAARFYSQSWALVHYLYADPERSTALQRYHADLLRGADPIEAFTAQFGKSVDEFDQDLRRYVRGRLSYQRYDNIIAPHDQVRVTELPDSADDLLLLDARVRGGVPVSEMPALLEQIRTIAGRFPNDVFAQTALARAILSSGDQAGARTVLEPLAAANTLDAELSYLIGRTYLEEGQVATEPEETERLMRLARRAFTAAHRIDPSHAGALHSFARASDIAADNTLNVALLARNLRPQVQEFAFSASYALRQHRQFRNAAALLRPLAYDPHGQSEQLQDMVAELERLQAEADGAP